MRYCVVDIEATGGNHRTGRIIEIGMVGIENNRIVDEFTATVNPHQPIDPYVRKLTGISDDVLRESPDFESISEQIMAFARGATFVAHNAGFDYAYLRTELKRAGFDYHAEQLCTLDLFRAMYPEEESYKLSKLAANRGVHMEQKHRALDDARATAHLFIQLLESADARKFLEKYTRSGHLIESYANRKRGVSDSALADLPDEPGVYYLKNKEGTVLYVGRGVSIRQEVLRNLSGNRKNERFLPFLESVSEVDFELSGNELLAELFFYRDVFHLKPLLNKHLNQLQYRYTIGADMKSKHPCLVLHRGFRKETKVVRQYKDYKSAEKDLNFLARQYELDKASFYPKIWRKSHDKLQDELRTQIETAYENESEQEKIKRLVKNERRHFNATFLLLADGRKANERVGVLVEKGQLNGFSYLQNGIPDLSELKNLVEPLPIREGTQIVRNFLNRRMRFELHHFKK